MCSLPMDDARPRTTITSDGTLKELTHVSTKPPRQPYQAYCITEASSRSPSPDISIPKPPDASLTQKPSRCLAPSPPSTCHPLPELPKHESPRGRSEYQAIIRKRRMRRIQCVHSKKTDLSKECNTTQAVTLRGSNRIMNPQTSLYHKTPSHSRIQHTQQTEPTSDQLSLHGNTRQCNLPITTRRPLPPLPLDQDCKLNDLDSCHTDNFGEVIVIHKHGMRSEPSLTYSLTLHDRQSDATLVASSVDRATQVEVSQPTSRESDLHNQTNPKPRHEQSNDICIRISSWSSNDPTNDLSTASNTNLIPNTQTQLSSSSGLYPSAYSSQVSTSKDPAERKIQVRDAQCKSVLARRHRLNDPYSQPTLHTSGQHPLPTPNYVSPFSISAPSLQSSHTRSSHSHSSQSGPRPPPWGSYDDLELMRKSRGEARDYLGAQSNPTESTLRSGPGANRAAGRMRAGGAKKDVDAFRKQILSVYPDWEGEWDGRRTKMWQRGCCVVM